jgi:putative tricarboxylic transport membrane protein
VSAPERLAGDLASVSTWAEQGVDCVIGAWRGITGPGGLQPHQVQFWAHCIGAAARQASWIEHLNKMHWTPMLQTGAALTDFLANERAEFVSVLRDLGLLRNV